MLKFVISYFALELLLVVSAVAITLWGRRRRLKPKRENPLEGFVKTEETFFDPTTGIKQQVWFKPQTGERYYITPKE